MVYEILHQNDMCQFYDLDEKAGVRIKTPTDQSDYAFLKDAETQRQLIDYEDEAQVKVTFSLPQIHCSACIWLLEHLYRFHDGITQSKVNFVKKEIYLTYRKEALTLQNLAALLASVGYAPDIRLNSLQEEKSSRRYRADRQFLYQLGVAAFAFGNIMLLSFPEYLGLDNLSDGAHYQFFGYLNGLLALPVLLYSGQPYWQSAWISLRKRHLNIDVPITIGMLTLFGRSAYEVVSGTGAGYWDSLAGLVFFLLIGKWFQQRTYHQISFDRDYTSYFPIAAYVKRGDQWESTPLTQLAVGDRVRVKDQELIPADGHLVAGEGRIDYSFVTGESEAVRREIGSLLYAGGRQQGGTIELVLSRVVSQSYLTQLWNNEAFEKEKETAFDSTLERISRFFTPAIMLIATVAGLYWWWADSSVALNAFTAVLIIACPCAIALSVPFALGNMMRQLGKRGFFVKHTSVIERLSQVTHLVLDKTGTMTETGSLTVRYEGLPLDDERRSWVQAVARASSHPISQAIAKEWSAATQPHQLTAVTSVAGQGISAEVAGHTILIGRPSWVDATTVQQGTVVAIDGKVVGAFQARHQLRTGLAGMLEGLRERYRLYLLSGDHAGEAATFAPYFGDQMRFEQHPKDKLAFVRDLQRGVAGATVVMVGDGLNDAGALQQSDVGIAVSEDAQYFSPACDVVMAADEVAHLGDYLTLSRQGMRIVRAALGISFFYNVVGLYFAVQGLLSPVIAAILMPLSSVTVVTFGVLATHGVFYRWSRQVAKR